WLKPRFEAVKGVAAAKVRGGLTPEIRVEADENRLATLGLTLDDLAGALRAENINQPGGTLKDLGAVYLVRTLHEFDGLEQVERTVVRETPDGRVRVEDVAEVFRGHRDREVVTRSGGSEVVELALHREGSTNTIAVAEAIKEELGRLRGELPEDLSVTLLDDQSVYIAEAISQVWAAAFLGLILAIVVLYFFLRDLLSTLIIAMTIPISVLGTFLFVNQAGVTLNIMSLGGLALGVGMLVDNSIVVLEAIDRRRRQGVARREAAASGAGEVAGAVTAATLTTVCVFLPIIFVQGVAGQLFYDLAVTVCLSLLASLLVSLTLIPSMAAWDPTAFGTHAGRTLFRWDQGAETGAALPWTFRFGRLTLAPVGNGRHWLSKGLTALLFVPRLLLAVVFLALGALLWAGLELFNLVTWPATRLFDGIGRAYPAALSGALRWRWAILPLTVAILVLSVMSARSIGTQLVPDLAQGEFAFRLYLPEGTPLESTAEVIDRIERPLAGDPRFRRVFSVIGEFPSAASGRQERGENLAQINFVLTEGAGSDTEAGAVARVRRVLELFPTVEAELVRPSVLTFAPPIGVQVFSDDLAQLETASAEMLRTMERLPGLRDVASSSEPGNPEIRIEVDRERAAALGVQADAMSRSLQRQIQ
ncbi:MAG: efflux RND transporter permease subunit, partial [Acidobacteriota bacterium]|nr:efflux RND transporter permease subunit [Acidobacteriota bacterium]